MIMVEMWDMDEVGIAAAELTEEDRKQMIEDGATHLVNLFAVNEEQLNEKIKQFLEGRYGGTFVIEKMEDLPEKITEEFRKKGL